MVKEFFSWLRAWLWDTYARAGFGEGVERRDDEANWE